MRICSFGEVNASIRAHYAIAAWRPALEAGLEIDADSEFPLARALREDSKRETLHMRLPQISADGVTLLVSKSPTKLLILDLNFSEITSPKSETVTKRVIMAHARMMFHCCCQPQA